MMQPSKSGRIKRYIGRTRVFHHGIGLCRRDLTTDGRHVARRIPALSFSPPRLGDPRRVVDQSF